MSGSPLFSCAINMASNEACVIDGCNEYQLYKHHKQKYLQRGLDMINLCQNLDRQEPKFESNISSKLTFRN